VKENRTWQTVIGIFYGTVKEKKGRKTATNDEDGSRRSILRILHENKFHPYHIYLRQNLEEPDFVSHMNFCNVMLRMINEDPTFLLRVLFFDEANNGHVNRHKMHYWAVKNPWILFLFNAVSL